MKIYKTVELKTHNERYFKFFITLCNEFGLEVQNMRNFKSKKGLPFIKDIPGVGMITVDQVEVE